MFPMDIFVGWLKTSGCNSSDFIDWGGHIHDEWEGVPPDEACLDWSIGGYNNEVDALIHYFDKNHQYRINPPIVDDYNLLFVDHWMVGSGNRLDFYNTHIVPYWENLNTFEIYDWYSNTNVPNYADYINSNRSLSSTSGHSSPYAKAFKNGYPDMEYDWSSGDSKYSNFYYWDLLNLDKIPYFSLENGCSTARFTEVNNIANWQVFHPGGGLVTIGATSALPVVQSQSAQWESQWPVHSWDGYILEGISQGKNIGEAYKYNYQQINESYWNMYNDADSYPCDSNLGKYIRMMGIGLIGGSVFIPTIVILGDPTLKVSTDWNVLGNVNLLNGVDIQDLNALKDYVLYDIPITDQQLALADMDGDGNVDILDVLELSRKIQSGSTGQTEFMGIQHQVGTIIDEIEELIDEIGA
jgi:hypothetical protein